VLRFFAHRHVDFRCWWWWYVEVLERTILGWADEAYMVALPRDSGFRSRLLLSPDSTCYN